jgi:hypothetical protein
MSLDDRPCAGRGQCAASPPPRPSAPPDDVARSIPRLLTDGRSRRVLFVSHRLLNENVRYLCGATRAGVVQEVLDRYTSDGIGIYQMPCPEQRARGGVVKTRVTPRYGSRALRGHTTSRVFVAAARRWTMWVYRRLGRRVAADIADYVGSGFDVVEVVGVGASPSCGVSTTLDLAHAVEAMANCDPSALDIDTVNQRVVGANSSTGAACSSPPPASAAPPRA